jgi:hypothetical protein
MTAGNDGPLRTVDRRGKAMADSSGSISYLRNMADRCRSAALQASGEEARTLAAIASDCERRLSERERVGKLLSPRRF